MENDMIRITKVPVRLLIDTLIGLHNAGADYVDIFGVPGPGQDEIGFSIKEEYMAPDEEMEDEEEDDGDGAEEEQNNFGQEAIDPISEEDISKLI
jgi:hypothetical protein